MVQLNEYEAKVYELLKRKHNQGEIEALTGKSRTFVLTKLHILVKKELATLTHNGRWPVFSPLVKPIQIINRRMKSSNRIGNFKKLAREYGIDNIRFIAYQYEAPVEYISRKTGIAERQIYKIRDRLAV